MFFYFLRLPFLVPTVHLSKTSSVLWWELENPEEGADEKQRKPQMPPLVSALMSEPLPENPEYMQGVEVLQRAEGLQCGLKGSTNLESDE